jgi:hypothetical protein
MTPSCTSGSVLYEFLLMELGTNSEHDFLTSLTLEEYRMTKFSRRRFSALNRTLRSPNTALELWTLTEPDAARIHSHPYCPNIDGNADSSGDNFEKEYQSFEASSPPWAIHFDAKAPDGTSHTITLTRAYILAHLHLVLENQNASVGDDFELERDSELICANRDGALTSVRWGDERGFLVARAVHGATRTGRGRSGRHGAGRSCAGVADGVAGARRSGSGSVGAVVAPCTALTGGPFERRPAGYFGVCRPKGEERMMDG